MSVCNPTVAISPIDGSLIEGPPVFWENNGSDIQNLNNGKVGIGRAPQTNQLEIEGEASKSTAGDWLANSDERLKKNIQPLDAQKTLQQMLNLQGITYQWADDKTGTKRPEGLQYGFTAQNIQQVFPHLVKEDAQGYLQTAYGTYDAMYVEAIRALHQRILHLEAANQELKTQLQAIHMLQTTVEALQAELGQSLTPKKGRRSSRE